MTAAIANSDLIVWPSSWRTAPLWALFERIKDVGHPDEEMLSVYRDYGVVKKASRDDNANKTAENRNIYQLVDNGWLVINRMKAWQGSVGISPHRGIVSGHYICFRPKHSENPRYLNYLLRSDVYTHEYARMSRGVRPNQVEIDNDELRSLPIRLPGRDEQRRIADDLDTEIATIARLEDLRMRQIELIKQRQTAILDAAIDEHISLFGTLPFRRYIAGVDQGSSPQCDAVPAAANEWGVLKVSSLRPGNFFPQENKRLPNSESPIAAHEVRAGDLLVTRANTPGLVGSTAVVPTVRPRLLLSDKIFRVRIDQTIEPQYIAAVASGSRIRALCSASSNGASQSMANIRFEDVKNWPIPRADRSAQESLIRRLSENLESIHALEVAIKSQLCVLAKRRQALIVTAVTGSPRFLRHDVIDSRLTTDDGDAEHQRDLGH